MKAVIFKIAQRRLNVEYTSRYQLYDCLNCLNVMPMTYISRQTHCSSQTPMTSHIEVRQFTLACELVCTGVGVWVVSELDAVKYQKLDLVFRPFMPSLPHGLFLVLPILKKPSLVTLEFMEHFRDSLIPFSKNHAPVGLSALG